MLRPGLLDRLLRHGQLACGAGGHRLCAWPLRMAVLAALAANLAGCSSLPPPLPHTPSQALAQPQATPLGQQIEARRQQAGARFPSGFHLLEGAEPAFTSRLALIAAATQTLDLQYYTIHADRSSERLLRALADAAGRGVRVRVLLDDWHSAGHNAQVMRLAFVPGVEMRLFNPVTGPRSAPALRALSALTDFDRVQQRMHNKLFIADNTLGIAGGRNLGDAYFDAQDSDNFIDVDVLAAGAIVQQLSRSFDRYWNDARAYPVQSLVSLDDLEQLQANPPHEAAPAPQATAATEPPGPLEALPPLSLSAVHWTWAPAVVLADAPAKISLPAGDHTASSDAAPVGPGVLQRPTPQALDAITAPATSANRQLLRRLLPPLQATESVVEGLLTLLDQAQQEVWIVSPYFVPGPEMKAAFARARARGVRVRILTNSLASNDSPLAHAGYARHRPDLLALGVELYELRSEHTERRTLRSTARRLASAGGSSRAMLHAKLMVMDGRLTTIGSMNLDQRSRLHNTEIALLIASGALARQTQAHIEDSLGEVAWKVEMDADGMVWRAPAETELQDQRTEPDASLPLRWMIHLIGPLAPDHLL